MGRWRRMTCCVLLGFILGVLLERTLQGLYRSDDGALSNLRVTCLIIVRSGHFRNVNASKLTWMTHCDSHIIVTRDKTKRNAVARNKSCDHPSENYSVVAENSWDFLCTSLRLLPLPLQWLIIVPDTLLVVFPNLNKFIRTKNWRNEHYIGHPIRHYEGAFNVLSAGILLSNGTVERLLGKFSSKAACRAGGKFWNNEDQYLGEHLQKLGILFEDTRDEKGRTRFHGFNINTLLFPGNIFRRTNYFKKAVFPLKEGLDCCSEDVITIDTSDAEHKLVHYFLINSAFKVANKEPTTYSSTERVPHWVDSLREIGYIGPTNLTNEEYFKIWEKHIPPEHLNEKLRKIVDVEE